MSGRLVRHPFRQQIDQVSVVRHFAAVEIDVRPVGAPNQTLGRVPHQRVRERRDLGIGQSCAVQRIGPDSLSQTRPLSIILNTALTAG